MTDAPDLESLLSDAYAARYRLHGGEGPTWEEAVAAIAASGIPRNTLANNRDALSNVAVRCVVSRVRAQALDEALQQIPA